MPPPSIDSSQEKTIKIEPRDPPFPTPVSQSSSQVRPKRAQDESNDDDTEGASADRVGPNLGNNLFTENQLRETYARRFEAARNASS